MMSKLGRLCKMLIVGISTSLMLSSCSLLVDHELDGSLTDPRGNDPYGVAVIDNVNSVYFNDVDSLNAAITLANQLQLPVYVYDGNYTFNVHSAPTEGFFGAGIIKFNNALIYDPEVEFVGIPHNLSQQVFTYPNYITEGNLIEAPLATVPTSKTVDILAHWYNDFGLARTAMAQNGQNGWHGWYDWRWNFTTNANYDPARHPLLGWYRGDDPKVLDWISYWMVKYGVKGTIITNNFRTTNWNQPSDSGHWLYQLFNHAKNFKLLKYSVWIAANHGITKVDATARDNDMIDNILANYDNVYCHVENGKRYPVFYGWNMEGFRGTHDSYNGTTNSVIYLKSLAQKCINLGYDGICIYGRTLATGAGTFTAGIRTDLKNNHVILLSQDYSSTYAHTRNGPYQAYAADSAVFPLDDFRVLNVMTSAKTQAPHPSQWNLYGSTPLLFQQALQHAVNVTKATAKPKTVVIYNVSEWAEGGPGLVPNQKDLFGYLEAISNISN
ncbi:hypothetical protein [Dyadobacter psychrotolerans]|uniref:Uncharacterized protein n=1 Tax=Dyadobacter psychrotolerans TaxID=2541721 RepID=A0A4R5DD99_9BACT|nr:hypothetical protein [Dyadobacter psychrotolerans]TDE11007.1 hypothetical protein E0F88_26260 [Dyadobacter psychrotolerans]